MIIKSKDQISPMMRYYLDQYTKDIDFKLPFINYEKEKIKNEEEWIKNKINYYKKRGYDEDLDIEVIKFIEINTLHNNQMWFRYKISVETYHSNFTIQSEEELINFINNKQTKKLNDIGMEIDRQYDIDEAKKNSFLKKIKAIICKRMKLWCWLYNER